MRRSDLSRKISLVAGSALVVLALAVVMLGVSLIAGRETPTAFANAWKEHRQACLRAPKELYYLDRSREVRGFVHGSDGKPVSGALVQCVRLNSLLQLAQSRPVTPALWSNLVETETRTDSDGWFEFPYLDVGSWTICVSDSGLAPDVESMVLVQDGTGARVDFTLEAPRSLRIRLEDAGDLPRRIHLVPHRWWPELVSRDLAKSETEVEFSRLGGPFTKGLVFVSDLSSNSGWQLRGAYDLDRSEEITISCIEEYTASPKDVAETAYLLSWEPDRTEAERLFFSMLTPVALFWEEALPPPVAAPKPGGQGPSGPQENGGLHGFGPSPFLPVLIESRDGLAWLAWTSAASEFEILGIPAGLYRVRAWDSFGRITFASGAIVPPGRIVDLDSRPVLEIQRDDLQSREVMGIVRWENGRPAMGAQVYLQDARDFRRFLERAETNENGFFWISNVPAGSYVAFVLPANDEHTMKNFIYPRVEEMPRERWLDFTLSPHRIIGQVPEGSAVGRVELVRMDEEGRERILWSVSPTEVGQFEIRNVPHGLYVVRAVREETAASVASLPFDVGGELTEVVRWPE